MAVKKTTNKKVIASVNIEDLKKVGDDVVKKVGDLKKKYDKLDDKTKKKIMFGLGAAAAVLSTAIALKKSKKDKNK